MCVYVCIYIYIYMPAGLLVLGKEHYNILHTRNHTSESILESSPSNPLSNFQ